VLSLVVAKKGDADIPGLTDGDKPRRLGPKRAGKIRKMFNLTKEDDVRKFVVRRPVSAKKTKSPKIQRLVTPVRLQRKRRVAAIKLERIEKAKSEKKDYEALLEKYRSSKAPKPAAAAAAATPAAAPAKLTGAAAGKSAPAAAKAPAAARAPAAAKAPAAAPVKGAAKPTAAATQSAPAAAKAKPTAIPVKSTPATKPAGKPSTAKTAAPAKKDKAPSKK